MFNFKHFNMLKIYLWASSTQKNRSAHKLLKYNLKRWLLLYPNWFFMPQKHIRIIIFYIFNNIRSNNSREYYRNSNLYDIIFDKIIFDLNILFHILYNIKLISRRKWIKLAKYNMWRCLDDYSSRYIIHIYE
jgi:hypothetical protein